jgi:hypothetical protein
MRNASAALTLSLAMLHWARSFGAIALVAAPAALAGAGALSVLAAAIVLLFLVLTALALLTGLFGRGRDGLYSGEDAVAVILLCVLAATALGVWLNGDAPLFAGALRALGA